MSAVPPIRVLLADDHKLFRAGIHSLLNTVPDIACVAEAEDGREVLRLTAAHRPDVVLMDIMMPQLNGLEALAMLARSSPDVRVIMLSMNADQDSVLKALRGGAAGYLVKTADPAELEHAIRAVARGERFLSAAIPDWRAMVAAASVETRAEAPASPLRLLSARELAVLQLVAQGKSSAEIGARLSLSVKTVETYRVRIRHKLGIDSLAGLVKFAIKAGITSPE